MTSANDGGLVATLFEDVTAFWMFFDNAADRQVKVIGTMFRDEHQQQFEVIQQFANLVGTHLKRLEACLNDQSLQHQSPKM